MASKAKQPARMTAAEAAVELPPRLRGAKEVVGKVSLRSVVKAAFALLAITAGVVLVVVLQHLIVLFLLGLFLAAVIDPGVRWLERRGVQQSIGILLHYAIFMAFAVFLLFSLIPVIAAQIADIAELADTEVQRLLTDRTISLPLTSPEVDVRLTILLRMLLRNLALNGPDSLEKLSMYLSSFTAGSLQFLTGLAGSVLVFLRDLLIVLLWAFFIQLERVRLYSWFRAFFPRRYHVYLDEKSAMINRKVGQWIRGQLLLCVVIGTLTFIILSILQMPYALTLALLAGFMEFVPYIGPLTGALPGVMIALADGGFTWALVIGAAYYVIQFCENNFIVPLIMKHAVDIPAVAIFVAMLVGVSFPTVLHPVLGILLSIPLASIVGIFLQDVRQMAKASGGTALHETRNPVH